MGKKLVMRRRTLVAAACGAMAAYFLDPASGRGRRARLRDRTGARVRRRRRAAARHARDAANREAGQQAIAHGGGRFHPVDDVEVAQHLKSVLARVPVDTSKVTIEVADGVTRLRGEVERAEHAGRVVDAVRHEPGVREVESWLHLPGQPSPNKLAALDASARAARTGQ
jgi:hypothetical protein